MIFALFNSKGGVGKTATAVNLAWMLAADGRRTLLWDLDPQAAATFYCRVKPKISGGAGKLVSKKRKLIDFVRTTDYPNFDVIPADFTARNLDLILDELKKSRKRLKSLLAELRDWYDYILLDAPPGFSVLAENLFVAADLILIPVIPTILSLRSYEMIRGYFRKNELDKERIMAFFSMVDIRKTIHREILAQRIGKDNHFLGATIPSLTDIEKMGIRRAPVPVFAPDSRATEAYRILLNEIMTRLAVDPTPFVR
jgi:chromosome partitioning protein